VFVSVRPSACSINLSSIIEMRLYNESGAIQPALPKNVKRSRVVEAREATVSVAHVRTWTFVCLMLWFHVQLLHAIFACNTLQLCIGGAWKNWVQYLHMKPRHYIAASNRLYTKYPTSRQRSSSSSLSFFFLLEGLSRGGGTNVFGVRTETTKYSAGGVDDHCDWCI